MISVLNSRGPDKWIVLHRQTPGPFFKKRTVGSWKVGFPFVQAWTLNLYMLRNLFIDWILPMLPTSTYHVFIFSFEEYFGGDSGNVTDRLHGVAEIAASSGAFAAILQGSDAWWHGRSGFWRRVVVPTVDTCGKLTHCRWFSSEDVGIENSPGFAIVFTLCSSFLGHRFRFGPVCSGSFNLGSCKATHESSTGTGRCAANPSSLAVEDSQNWIKGL